MVFLKRRNMLLMILKKSPLKRLSPSKLFLNGTDFIKQIEIIRLLNLEIPSITKPMIVMSFAQHHNLLSTNSLTF